MATGGACRLWLGTAQFGLAYGATNRRGRVPVAETAAILDQAYAAGVRVLDTAPAYGESEAVLGRLGAAKRFGIITKTSQLTSPTVGDADLDWIGRAFDASLATLAADRVDGLLVHGPGDLLVPGADRLFGLLDGARRDGRAGRIGVSAYDPDELLRIIDRYDIDIAQIPVNILDQRFLAPELLSRCRDRGVTLCSRSVFLQGLLLTPPDDMPVGFDRFHEPVARLRALAGPRSQTLIAACLSAPLSHTAIEGVICGVTTATELTDLLAGFSGGLPALALSALALSALATDDPALIDPRVW